MSSRPPKAAPCILPFIILAFSCKCHSTQQNVLHLTFQQPSHFQCSCSFALCICHLAVPIETMSPFQHLHLQACETLPVTHCGASLLLYGQTVYHLFAFMGCRQQQQAGHPRACNCFRQTRSRWLAWGCSSAWQAACHSCPLGAASGQCYLYTTRPPAPLSGLLSLHPVLLHGPAILLTCIRHCITS